MTIIQDFLYWLWSMLCAFGNKFYCLDDSAIDVPTYTSPISSPVHRQPRRATAPIVSKALVPDVWKLVALPTIGEEHHIDGNIHSLICFQDITLDEEDTQSVDGVEEECRDFVEEKNPASHEESSFGDNDSTSSLECFEINEERALNSLSGFGAKRCPWEGFLSEVCASVDFNVGTVDDCCRDMSSFSLVRAKPARVETPKLLFFKPDWEPTTSTTPKYEFLNRVPVSRRISDTPFWQNSEYRKTVQAVEASVANEASDFWSTKAPKEFYGPWKTYTEHEHNLITLRDSLMVQRELRRLCIFEQLPARCRDVSRGKMEINLRILHLPGVERVWYDGSRVLNVIYCASYSPESLYSMDQRRSKWKPCWRVVDPVEDFVEASTSAMGSGSSFPANNCFTNVGEIIKAHQWKPIPKLQSAGLGPIFPIFEKCECCFSPGC